MAMLGLDDYLCEACRNFNTDGIDGNHPFCSKRYGDSQAVGLDEECPYYEPGVPSGYPVSMKRNKERAEKVTQALERMKKDAQETEGHPQPKERWTTALLSDLAWPDDGSWPDYLSVARNKESAGGGEWRVYAPEKTCHMEVHANFEETAGTYEVWLECDECHWKMPLEPTTPRFKYCPNCRAKVVSE